MQLRYTLLLVVVPALIANAQQPEPTEAPTAVKYVLFPTVGVKIVRPEGFEDAKNFNGFLQMATGASVMVMRIPGPYSEVTKGFKADVMLKRGMRLHSKEPVKIDGLAGWLMSVSQSTQGIEFAKWMVVAGDEKRCVMVMATIPVAHREKLSAPLRKIVLGARLDESMIGTAKPAVGFSITASKKLMPFKASAGMGKMLLYTVDGKAHPKDPESPYFVAAPSISDTEIADKRQFAVQRLFQTTKDTKVSAIKWTKAISIDGLDGFESLADAHVGGPDKSIIIYQVMLFTGKSYVLMQGHVGADGAQQWLPEFKAMARSFKRDKKRAKTSHK